MCFFSAIVFLLGVVEFVDETVVILKVFLFDVESLEPPSDPLRRGRGVCLGSRARGEFSAVEHTGDGVGTVTSEAGSVGHRAEYVGDAVAVGELENPLEVVAGATAPVDA